MWRSCAQRRIDGCQRRRIGIYPHYPLVNEHILTRRDTAPIKFKIEPAITSSAQIQGQQLGTGTPRGIEFAEEDEILI